MLRPGKNHGGYHGETIDIRAVLREVETAAQRHGWTSEVFHERSELKLLALHRLPLSTLNFERSTATRTSKCRLQPTILCARSNAASATSVAWFPRERMRDISSDRFFLVKTSDILF